MPIWILLLVGGAVAAVAATSSPSSGSAKIVAPGSTPATKEADDIRTSLMAGAAASKAVRDARNEKAKHMFDDAKLLGPYGAAAVALWQGAVDVLTKAGSLFHDRDSQAQIDRAESIYKAYLLRGFAPNRLDSSLVDAEAYGDILQGALDYIAAAGPFVSGKLNTFAALRKKWWPQDDLVDSITTAELQGSGDFFNMFPKMPGSMRNPIFLAGRLLAREYGVPEAPVEQAALDWNAGFDARHPGGAGNYIAENITRLAESFHRAEQVAVGLTGAKVPDLRIYV